MANADIYTWQNHNADIELAKRLQEQFNHEANVEKPLGNLVYESKQKLNTSKSLIDPSWELVDPTPDIYNLFIVFNNQFFWGKLGAVSVKWSKRMTSCAGICSYSYRGGMCVIALSEPLLKLRPRKDLVETLLHEMIHALLFVTHNNKDRDGHGPEFHKHMYRINAEAGTKITVYHSFHDEVRLYQQHWWKCDGPCQHRKPFFGMVKRATNRAPGPNDRWWGEHSRSCGGSFKKIKEPEKPEKKKKSEKENKKPVEPSKKHNDIRNYIPGVATANASNSKLGKPTVNMFENNKVPTSGTLNKINSLPTSTKTSGSYNGKNNINGFHNIDNLQKSPTKKNPTVNNKDYNGKNDINGFHNIDDLGKEAAAPKPIEVFTGNGNLLTTSAVKPNSYETAREAWLKKFNDSLKSKKKRTSTLPDLSPAKKTCVENEVLKENKILVKCPVCNTSIEDKKLNSHLDTCLENTEGNEPCPVCNKSILKSDLQRHINACLDGGDHDEGNDISPSVSVQEEEQGKSTCDSSSPTRREVKKCEVCGINQPLDKYNQHMADCLVIFCGNIVGMANASFNISNNESIYLDSDEEESFFNDNSLIEDYNKSVAKSKSPKKPCKDDKSERIESIYFDSDDEESFLNDNSLIEDYNKSLNKSGDDSSRVILLDD